MCASRDIRSWDSNYFCLILHGYHARMVNWAKGALRGNCRIKHGKTFFPLVGFSALSKLSSKVLGCRSVAFVDWSGQAPRPWVRGVDVEVVG